MKKYAIVILSGMLLFASGCKSTIPMPSYLNQPIAKYGSEKNTAEDIEKSIVQGAVSLGWKTEVIKPGEILATLDIRKHQLVILITHDNEKLSIKYKDSKQLKYNGRHIHRQYANWISNLLKAINVNNITN